MHPQVLVVDCFGRTPATWVGVRVPRSTGRQQLLDALRPLLQPAFSHAAEALHLVSAHGSSLADVGYFDSVGADAVVDDPFFGPPAAPSVTLVVFRTAHFPKPAASHDGKGSKAAAGAAAAAAPKPLAPGESPFASPPVLVHPTQPGVNGYPYNGFRQPAWVVVMPRRRKAGAAPRAGRRRIASDDDDDDSGSVDSLLQVRWRNEEPGGGWGSGRRASVHVTYSAGRLLTFKLCWFLVAIG